MALIDVKKQFEDIKNSAMNAVRDLFPVEKQKHTLKLDRVYVEDSANQTDYSQQAKAKGKGRSWGANVYADLVLIDNATKKVIDRQKKVKLFLLPKLTPRASYIVGGNEYQVANQLRLRPGAYVKKTKTGDVKTQINLSKGGSANIIVSAQNIIQVEVNQAKIPLFPLLIGLGISEQVLIKRWGKAVVDQNRATPTKPQAAVKRFAKSFARTDTNNFDTAKESISNYFDKKTEIDPEMTKLTLGTAYDKFSPMLLLDASSKLVAVERGDTEPDDVDNLAFKEFFGIEDAIKERIEKNKTSLLYKIRRNLDSRAKISQIVNFNTFSSTVEKFFTEDDRSSTTEQINPLSMFAGHEKISFLGPGSIASTQQATDEMRSVHPTHLSFIDPVHTPECYDSTTEVFTDTGWVKWPDVTTRTKFACRIDGFLEYHLPERVVSAPYTGKMLGAKNSKIDYLVTPNHRMFVRPLDSCKDSWRIELASDSHMKPRTLCTTHQPTQTSIKEFPLPNVEGGNAMKIQKAFPETLWAKFLGWFLSEGNSRYNEEKSDYLVRISQDREINPTKCKEIEDVLSAMQLSWCYTSSGDYCFGNKQIASLLRNQGYSFNKFIPEYVFGFSPTAREAFLRAFLLGDGRTISNRSNGNSYPQEVYCTTSISLAEGIDRVLVGLGKSVVTKRYSDDREDRYKDVYEVRVQQRTVRSVRPYNRRSKRSDYYEIEYEGSVYCATVPGGLLLVRRGGGVAIWLGNSEKIGLNLALTLGAKKKGRDLVAGFYSLKTKKIEELKPLQVFNNTVAYPDQWDAKTKKFRGTKIKAQRKGKLVVVPISEIDYVMPYAQNAFALSTNMIPFMANDNGNRTMMAGKHMEQAIPLKFREAPLVQTKVGPETNTSFEEAVGITQAVYATSDGTNDGSPISGKVKRITKDSITITSKGRDTVIPLYNNFSLNQKTFMDNNPVVAVGDTVSGRQLLADSNFTKGGVLALGKNLSTAYVPYRGYNFEDGIVITETAAKKLTSEHIHKKQLGVTPRVLVNLGKFAANFPNDLPAESRAKLGQDGIIRKGAKVTQGTLLIAALRNTGGPQGAEVIKRRIHKSIASNYKNIGVYWTSNVEGIVTDVQQTSDKITVYVKTAEPALIGDKLAGRHGNKGIITKIIPDSLAPRNNKDEPVEVMLNPHGVISRINIGQMYESAAGKMSKATGKPYKVENFSGKNYLKEIKAELKAAGIDDEEELTDPLTGKSMGKVHVGNPYILKLNKQSDVNFSVRGESGPVTRTSLQPIKGGEEGSKAVDMLTMYSLLSHGAKANLQEMATIKSENNPEYWEALKYGRHLPAPKTPFVYKRFETMLKGAGVDIKKDGSRYQLMPLTDKQTKKLSNMEISTPQFALAKKDQLIETKGGFLDTKFLGGAEGDGWSHIELKERMPNPIFEKAIRTLTSLTAGEYESVLGSKKFVDIGGKQVSGPKAIEGLLANINVEGELKTLKPLLSTQKGSKLDATIKKYRFLKHLKDSNLSPVEAYTRKLIPVIPPRFRPITTMESGDLAGDDTNWIYRNISLLSNQLKLPVTDVLDSDIDLGDIKLELNKQLKGLAGLTDIKFSGKDKKGFLAQIGGRPQPKHGFFQNKVLRKNQNLVGRGTIIPEPQLDMDEVALPEKMSWKLFAPFVIKELIRSGLSASRAKEEMVNKTPLARNALKKAMDSRPVMLNRAPSLHKFSVMAFKPKITEGKAIKIPPLVVNGFNADFDGDTMTVHVPIGDKAVRESYKMMPSRNLYKPGSGSLMVGPSQESQLGFYLMTKEVEGRKKLNAILPTKYAIRGEMNKRASKELFMSLSKNMPTEEFSKLIDKIKVLGETSATEKGFSLALKDIITLPGKEKLIAEIELEAAKAMKNRNLLGSFEDKLIRKGGMQDKIDKKIVNFLKDKDNAFYEMVNSGARGNLAQLRQIVVSPLILKDPQGNAVPKTIEKSFAEGLDLSDYWIASYGARKGMMDRAQGTQEPGVFNKMLMSATMDNVVSMEDCGTKNGKIFSTNDSEILGRFIQGSQAGINDKTLIKEDIQKLLRRKLKNVKTRSPLTCEAPKGTCRLCYGVDESGEVVLIGDNLGAKAAQTMAEPLTQMTMNCEDGLVQIGSEYIAFIDFYEDVLKDVPAGFDGVCEYKFIDSIVMGKSGEVKSFAIQRHAPDDKLFFLKTKSGNTIICQGNHPLFIKENPIHPKYHNKSCRIIGKDVYVDSISRVPFSTDHKVKEISTRDVEKYDAIWIDNSSALLQGNVRPEISGYVSGLYAAEGCIRVGNGTKAYEGREVAVVITQSENSIKEQCLLISKYTNLNPKPSTKEIQYYGRDICTKFRKIVKGSYAWQKRLAYDFNSYSPGWLKSFLEGVIDGDGTVYSLHGVTVAKVYTSSYYLLQQLQVIGIKLGLKTNSTLVSQQKLAKRPQFAIEIRFPKDYSVGESIKIPHDFTSFSQKKEVVVSGFDVITTAKEIWKWEYPVYDLKTETKEFMLGGVQCHNSFHTGGAAGSGTKNGYQRIQDLTSLPKNMKVGKATLAPQTGKVKKIEKSGLGGYNIYMDSGKKLVTSKGSKLKVGINDSVKRGDILTEGYIMPQELLELKDMREVQDYMTNELQSAYASEDVNINRKTFETVVRSLTNRTRVLNDVDNLEFSPGDTMTLSAAEAYNTNRGNSPKLEHQPYLAGLSTIPQRNQDWMAQMGARQITDAVVRGASQGWMSDTKGYHPIPAYAIGTGFGDGPEGKY